MMDDEKDRLGDKLRKKERAEEDRFFAERDKAMLERLRQKLSTAELEELRDATRSRCPKCGARLVPVAHHDVTVEECPTEHGMWLDKGQLKVLATRERDSWIGRFFYRPRR